MKSKNRSLRIFSLTQQMSGLGLLLTYVAYPLVLLFEFLSFGAASPASTFTLNIMTVIFFLTVFITGFVLSLSDERSVSQQMKTLIFFAVTIVPTMAMHSAKFVIWALDIKI